jgi:PTS system nitrogen regulatory IIA component
MSEDPKSIPEFVKSEYLSIGQLASNLGWSIRFIEGLVRGERLPGLQFDGTWYFRRDEVIDWLEQKIQTLDSNRVIELEKRVESSLVKEGIYRRLIAPDRLASRLPDDGIILDADLQTKNDVLRALAALADSTGLVYDREYLLASLFDRETLCSTAMPGGVALCHPRRPIPMAISTQFLCFLRTREPVYFGSDTGEDTSVFFLLCAPDDRSHLYGLAHIARILHHGALDLLKEAATPNAVKQILADFENRIQRSEQGTDTPSLQ